MKTQIRLALLALCATLPFTTLPSAAGAPNGRPQFQWKDAKPGRHGGWSHHESRHGTDPSLTVPGFYPMWTGSYAWQGTPYRYLTVGTDPERGSATTVIPTVIIPLRFKFADGSVYDMSHELIDGVTAMDSIRQSPIFQPTDFYVGGTFVGHTQLVDAYTRANNWATVSRRAPNYHVLLGQPKVLSPVTIDVPDGHVFFYHDDATGLDVPFLNNVSQDPLEAAIRANGIPPNALTIFVAGVVQWNGKGFNDHSQDARGAADHSYIVTVYNPVALFGDDHAPNTYTLAHELMEWFNNPLGTNETPGWNHAAVVSKECTSASARDPQSVSDPIENLGSIHVLPGSGVRDYYTQDFVFVDWFTRQASRSAGGTYSFFGDVSGATTPCLGHLPLADQQLFSWPGSDFTAAFGINNRDDVAGMYRDSAGAFHGFSRIDGRLASIDVPTMTDTYANAINDRGVVVGYATDEFGNWHAFSADHGDIRQIDVPGSHGTYAQGVASDGAIVGGFLDSNYLTHGFLLRNGRFTTFDSGIGAQSELSGMNDRNVLVGDSPSDDFSTYTGFARDARGVVSPIQLAGSSNALLYGINNFNDIVGWEYRVGDCVCKSGYVGFVSHLESGVIRDRYVVGIVSGINDRGHVAGSKYGQAFVATAPGYGGGR